MSTSSHDQTARRPRLLAPWLVLALTLLATSAVALYVSRATRTRDRLRFDNAVRRTEDDLRTRLDTYVTLLRAGAGLFAASGDVTREDWRAFVGRLDLAAHHPGAQGVGFARRVAPADLPALAEGVRREEGLGGFALRPGGEREEYFPIVYIEPLDGRNRGALGFDMFSEPVRRAAMERARDTGAPAASGRVTLVQEAVEAEKQSGFLLYVPVYRGGATPPTVEGRRAALVGFVYSPFRAGDLLRGIFGHELNPVADFRVYDGAGTEASGLMHGPAGEPGHEPRFTSTRTFDVEGRPWTLAFFTRPEIELASGGWVVSLVLAGGALFGVVFFFITRAQGRARREAERAAARSRASEARFRTLVEQSPVSTQIFSPDGRTVRVNRAWEELWGVTLERLGGYNILEDPQLEEKGIAPYIRRGFAGEAVAVPAILYDPEQTIPGKTVHQDPRRWVSAVIYPVKDEAGRVREVVLMHQDITEQRRAEERLRESHAQVTDILESISDAFYAVDADWRFTYVNRRAEELWGRRREDLVGKDIWEEFPGGVGSRAHGELLRAAAERRPVNFETASPVLDLWLEVSAYPTGRGLSVYFRDITARKRAEEEREQLLGREREARERAEGAEGRAAFLASASAALDSSLEYETTLETVAHLAVPALADFCFFDLVAPGGKIQRVTWKHKDPETHRAFDEVWRFAPPRELEGNPVARTLRTGKTEFVDEVTEEWMRAAATSPEHFEFMRRQRFHSLLTVVLAAREQTIGALTFCLVGPGRKFTPADVATAEDLARRAALAVSNARLYREAQEANRLKDEFLATLSHELRTPLTSVLGWAKLLRTERFDPQVTERALEAIERNAAAQTRLINDLLDVSRIVTGKLRLNVAPVELAPVIEAAVESLRPAAEARGVRLRLALEGRPGPVSGDADRLQQVVWNLLSNAIKFTPRGGRVEVRLDARDGHAELAVADEGDGIAPEFLPHVFERFRQADGAITREHGGLGLGLAIVRHLVELHGGRVRAESEGHGRGATFTVSLPLLRVGDFGSRNEEERDAAADDQPATRNPQPAILSGLHVLVVEDDEDSRALISTVLEGGGARVTASGSAAAGLDLLRRLRPDVLVADIGMAGEDGYELLRKVRALDPAEGGETPAAALTAYARPEDRAEALAAGYQLHLAKPVAPSALTEAVAGLAGRRG